MSNKVMGGNAYRGDCPDCGKALFGTSRHLCPKSARVIELAKKRKEKLTKQILETTKDFGIEKPLEGWDEILDEFSQFTNGKVKLGDWLKQNYKTPKKL